MKLILSKLAVGLIILICALLPLMKYELSNNSTFVDTIEESSKKLKNDKLSLLKDFWSWGKKKLFDEESHVVKPLSLVEKISSIIYTGFNYGLSSVGALKETINNFKFRLYNTSLISASVILILLVVQFLINWSTKLRTHFLKLIALLTLLVLVVLIGSSSNETVTVPLMKGWLPFLILQSWMIFTVKTDKTISVKV